MNSTDVNNTSINSEDERNSNDGTTTTTSELEGILSGIRITVLVLTAITAIGTIYCTLWIYKHRKKRIVKAHQPEFLITICVGLFLWEMSVIPFSIDGTAVSSARGCNVACILFPWFNYLGFTLAIAGLYSKLWRINKIFHNAQFRKISVTVTDVLKPFACMFSSVFLLLLLWTILDPPTWVNFPLDSIDSNDTVSSANGVCATGSIGTLLSSLLLIIRLIVLFATIWQAYKARNVSSDFSETWPLAIGLLNWIQLYIFTIPVLVLLSYGAPSASYYLIAVSLLAGCVTMLLAIFLPVYLHPSIRHPPPMIGDNIRVARTDNRPVVTGVTGDSVRSYDIDGIDDEESGNDKESPDNVEHATTTQIDNNNENHLPASTDR